MNSYANCESKLNGLLNNHEQKPDFSGLVVQLKTLDDTCKESDFYFLKLGWAHTHLNQHREALAAYKKGLTVAKKYRESLEVAIAETHLYWPLKNEAKIKEFPLAQSKKMVSSLIARYPENSQALALMTAVALFESDFEKVITYGQRAIDIEPHPYAYRNMALAYAKLKKAEEAAIAAGKALELNESMEADKNLMIALSMAYYELDRVDLAFGTIRALVEADNAMFEDPLVKQIGLQLQTEFQQIKSKQN